MKSDSDKNEWVILNTFLGVESKKVDKWKLLHVLEGIHTFPSNFDCGIANRSAHLQSSCLGYTCTPDTGVCELLVVIVVNSMLLVE